MNVNKAELDEFFTRLESLEADKKSVADEIKESVEAFAKNKELEKKSVSKAFKEWKEIKKDKENYVLTDLESDALLLIAVPELATTDEED